MFVACLAAAAALVPACVSPAGEDDDSAGSDDAATMTEGDDGTAGGADSSGEGSDDAADETTTAQSGDTTGEPSGGFTPADCRFLISDGLVAGVDYECGDLAVPEQRGAADSPEIHVHFVRFFGPGGAANATVYLDGGPGGSGQSFAGFPAEAIEAFAASGDFVVVGQRGTVLAEPALTCDTPASTPETAQSCRDALLASEIELTGFTTPANADDLEDLRVALGYQQWNLLGISYGTRLAQEVMRRHPASVRAAIIDGVVAPQVNWDMRAKISFWQAAQGLSEACSADPVCLDAFGVFDQALLDMIDALDVAPLFVGPPGERFQLDGGTAARIVFRMMYETSLYPVLPLVVTSLRDADLQAIGTILMLFVGNQEGPPQAALAPGMHWSVKCSDLYNPELGPGIDTALIDAGVPESLANHATAEYEDVVDICALWPKPEPDPSLAMPVESDVPTLISSGAFDPITPPGYGHLVAETMVNHLEVTFANTGHGALPQSECSRALFAAFVEDPQATIDAYDASCAMDIELDFVTSEEEFLGTTTAEHREAVAARLRSRR